MTASLDPFARSWTTIVVGAGSAGAVLASRLSEDPGRDVLLLEAGPDHDGTRFQDPDSLWAADPRAGFASAYDVALTRARRVTMTRGRVVGGSSAVNGAYFVRARRFDHDRWAAVSDLWSHSATLPSYQASECDLDFGELSCHGDAGPVPVSRARSASHPLSEAFVTACRDRGLPDEPDKNGDLTSGIGPLPRNLIQGRRVDASSAYLAPQVRTRPNLRVVAGTRVLRIRWAGARATGVVVSHGGRTYTVASDEVLLAGGAIASAHLLLLSGVGPAADLRRADITPLVDLPVGRAFHDHPSLRLSLRPGESDLSTHPPLFEYLLNTASSDARGADDLQVMPALRPLPPDGEDGPLSLLVTLQESDARGRLRIVSPDPDRPPDIAFNYLTAARDRVRFREGVRLVQELCTHPAMSVRASAEAWSDLRSDSEIDAWVRDRVGTSIHMSGTCPFGNDPRTSVVDPTGRVHGTSGLRVADTSILPTAPTRGTAATAIMLGEHVARLLTSVRPPAGSGPGRCSG